MFFLKYLRRELANRRRQALFVALGLAVGIGLVITVTATASGVKAAQGKVVHALYGVGTDLTVTKPPSAPAAGQPPPGAISIGAGGKITGGNISGNTIENLQDANLATLEYPAVSSVAGLHGVSAVAGGFILNDFKATLPGSAAPGTGGGPQTYSLDGVDTSHLGLGPLSAGKIASGRNLSAADENSGVAVVDSSYATVQKLHVGSTVTIIGHQFTVVGVVNQPQGSNPPQVYIPLARAQALYASADGAAGNLINTIYVTTASAADVSGVQNEIRGLLPSVTVTSQDSLAGQVTGSLASTSSLANDLGRWLAVIVLLAAFAVASLLTLSAVARRVREFGTLKALGWRSRRIIGQVLGAAVGVGLGYGAAAVITAIAPHLSATVGSAPPAQAGGGGFGGHVSGVTAPHTVPVVLTAPVPGSIIIIAVALAVAGGLIAGSFGSWRIARLSPAAALSRVA